MALGLQEERETERTERGEGGGRERGCDSIVLYVELQDADQFET